LGTEQQFARRFIERNVAGLPNNIDDLDSREWPMDQRERLEVRPIDGIPSLARDDYPRNLPPKGNRLFEKILAAARRKIDEKRREIGILENRIPIIPIPNPNDIETIPLKGIDNAIENPSEKNHSTPARNLGNRCLSNITHITKIDS